MSNTEALEKTLGELRRIERTTTKLLQLNKLPPDSLKKKLSRLEGLAGTIPRTRIDLAHFWNDRLAELSTKFNRNYGNDNNRPVSNVLYQNDQTEESLDKLVRQLTLLERLITKSLTLETVPIANLNSNLSMLEQSVLSIPLKHFHLIQQWNDKLVLLKQQFTQATLAHLMSDHLDIAKKDDSPKKCKSECLQMSISYGNQSDSVEQMQAQQISRKLNKILHSIEHMFDLHSVDMLDIKIKQLVDVIFEMPIELIELRNQLCDTVAKAMQRYAVVSGQIGVQNQYGN